MLEKAFGILKKNSLAALLILIGSITWSLTMVKSGLIYDYGMGFWGPNGHDGVWHIALIKSLARGSWEMPVFAGEALKNYHLGYDLLLAWISRLTKLDPITLYFQVAPPVLAFLIGILTYKFILDWKSSKIRALWATFFVYFGGSFGWIVSLIRTGGLGGESMFWAQQAISTLINPPFALSLVLILCGLIYLTKFLKSQKPLHLLFSVLFFGVLVQIKVYAGVLVLGGLGVSAAYRLFREKKTDLLWVFLGSLAVCLVLFLPVNKGSEALIVFKPFWFLESMMGFPDRVGWERFYSAMTNWRLGNIWIKAAPAYLVAFAIFWFGNLGTRVIKEVLVIRWLRNLNKISFLEVFIASVIVAGAVLPMLFLQKGTPWNTIQFVYYSLFFSAILAGVVLGEWAEKYKGIKVTAVGFLLIVFTLPTTAGTLRHYLPSRPPAMVSIQELEALDFLSGKPPGTTLTYPFDRQKAIEAEAFPPRPLYLYESTAYVSALSGQPVYLEDQVNLDITGYGWGERRNMVKSFLEGTDVNWAKSFLRENNISYVYWIKGQNFTLDEGQIGMKQIFENSLVSIYQVE